MAVANGCSAVASGETRPEDPGYEDSRGSRRDSVGAYSGGNCYLVKTDVFGPPLSRIPGCVPYRERFRYISRDFGFFVNFRVLRFTG